jgi:hypothetical protein
MLVAVLIISSTKPTVPNKPARREYRLAPVGFYRLLSAFLDMPPSSNTPNRPPDRAGKNVLRLTPVNVASDLHTFLPRRDPGQAKNILRPGIGWLSLAFISIFRCPEPPNSNLSASKKTRRD